MEGIWTLGMSSMRAIKNSDFPFHWINIDSLPDSKGIKKEVYLIENKKTVGDLMFLFYSLFGSLKDKILVYNNSWWDFCIETWNFNTDKYDYLLEGKSKECKDYLKLLIDSQIEIGYSGSCEFIHLDICLPIILKCIVSHKAPYSPIFYNKENDFFFYFHHSGSIGFYYYRSNEIIDEIMKIANDEFQVVA